VDRGLSGILNGAPLVLIGIAEELAVYRSVSDYPRVLEVKPTSPEHLAWADLAERSMQAVMENRQKEATHVLGEFRETTRRDHVTSGVRQVLEAACQGRVHRLLLEKGAHEMGLLGPLFPVDDSGLEGEQDLINAAAVETIRARGEVDVLDPGAIGDAGPIAAILRYS
jgi:Bacterial archaeo-eukaryotic release factor family 3